MFVALEGWSVRGNERKIREPLYKPALGIGFVHFWTK